MMETRSITPGVHLLRTDVPRVGKALTAKSLDRYIGGQFWHIKFTKPLNFIMKVSLKTNVLGQVLAVSGLAVGIAAGISAAPAQAVVFTTGELSFADGTNNFFPAVDLTSNPGFAVNFNPNPGHQALVGPQPSAPTSFTPFFGNAGGLLSLNNASTGNFVYSGSGSTYTLSNNLLFSFSNGVNLTVGMGSQFEGINLAGGVQFGLTNNVGSFFQDTNLGAGEVTTANIGSFTFGDTSGLGNGGYQISAAPGTPAAVPEPFTIIGSIIGGTSAFRMKKKLAAAAKK